MSLGDVSVIVPVYNNEHSIERCLKSILTQTRAVDNIIIVNDGSTDESGTKIKPYLTLASVVYIEQPNGGAASARNRGLQLVDTEFVTFLDADDYWKTTFVETCTKFLSANDDCSIVSTAQELRTLGKLDRINPQIKAKHSIKISNFFEFWAEYDHVNTGSVVFRSELIGKVGGQRIDLRQSQDLEYWAMLSFHGKWAYIPEALVVNDGMASAIKSGWKNKYAHRNQSTITIEDWESRIVTLLNPEADLYYSRIRGKVAFGYFLRYILGGQNELAFATLKKHSKIYPSSYLARLFTNSLVLQSSNIFAFLCFLYRIRDRLLIIKREFSFSNL